jgi:hypothetical protein
MEANMTLWGLDVAKILMLIGYIALALLIIIALRYIFFGLILGKASSYRFKNKGGKVENHTGTNDIGMNSEQIKAMRGWSPKQMEVFFSLHYKTRMEIEIKKLEQQNIKGKETTETKKNSKA